MRKKTDQEVNQIFNEAREIFQNATARAEVIIATAKAQALGRVEDQRAASLATLYTDAGISSASNKASFNYIRALRENQKNKLYLNFQSLQARP